MKFSGISHFCAIVEMDEEGSLYAPELSFGSHMFQDLVEAEIFYTALFHVTKEDEALRKEFFPEVCENTPAAGTVCGAVTYGEYL